MKKRVKKTDINAYILELKKEIIDIAGDKKVNLLLKNLNYDRVTALKFRVAAWDSFEERVMFDNSDYCIIKVPDLNIGKCALDNIVIDLEKHDVKKVDIEIIQIVFDNKGITDSLPEEIVEYEYDELEENIYEEKEQLLAMREINSRAICYPYTDENGWVCTCGYYNKKENEYCASCNAENKIMRKLITPDRIKKLIEKRKQDKIKLEREMKEKKKRETEKRLSEYNAEVARKKELQEKKCRMNKIILISVSVVLMMSVMLLVVRNNAYTRKYSLHGEEKKQYDIQISNYKKINEVLEDRELKFSDVASGYKDEYDAPSRLGTALTDDSYLYIRGYYLATPFLYEKIKNKFPVKYRSTYETISKLKKAQTYYNCIAVEGLYVDSYKSVVSSYFDTEKEIEEKIKNNEVYLYEEVLNTEKVSLDKYDFDKTEKMKERVYGLNLGILFYSDGAIKYIGEYSNGKANGYGYSWYSTEDGGGEFAKGEFSDGYLDEAESHYDKNGNTNNINDAKKVTFSGDFVKIEGFEDSVSSVEMANLTEDDMYNARAACASYLVDLENMHSSITGTDIIGDPVVDGCYFYFTCSVRDGNMDRTGKVTVMKKNDGSFKVNGLTYQ